MSCTELRITVFILQFDQTGPREEEVTTPMDSLVLRTLRQICGISMGGPQRHVIQVGLSTAGHITMYKCDANLTIYHVLLPPPVSHSSNNHLSTISEHAPNFWKQNFPTFEFMAVADQLSKTWTVASPRCTASTELLPACHDTAVPLLASSTTYLYSATKPE